MTTTDVELGGRIVRPGDARYDDARRAWNLSVDQRPAAVVEARDAPDVAAARRVAARAPERGGARRCRSRPTPRCAWRRRAPATAPRCSARWTARCSCGRTRCVTSPWTPWRA